MNKTELIAAVAERGNLSKKDAGKAVDAVFDIIKEKTAVGEKTSIPGFGSFERKLRPERQGRNLRTGEAMVVPAHNVPAFKPGKSFKNMM